MWPFSSSEHKCKPNRPGTHEINEIDEYAVNKFHPIAQDDEYVYGRRETQKMLECQECGEKMAPMTIAPKTFEKMKKSEIPETKRNEVEVSVEMLKYK